MINRISKNRILGFILNRLTKQRIVYNNVQNINRLINNSTGQQTDIDLFTLSNRQICCMSVFRSANIGSILLFTVNLTNSAGLGCGTLHETKSASLTDTGAYPVNCTMS
jgi:hypothetical protein